MKEPILSQILLALLLFFTPIQGLITAIIVVTLLNTFTGIIKTVKLYSIKAISPQRLLDCFTKIFIYIMCVVCIFPLDYYLLNEFLIKWFSMDYFFTKLCTILVCTMELKSIKENVELILNVDFWSLIKNILNKGKDISKDIKDIKNGGDDNYNNYPQN